MSKLVNLRNTFNRQRLNSRNMILNVFQGLIINKGLNRINFGDHGKINLFFPMIGVVEPGDQGSIENKTILRAMLYNN